MVAIFHHIGHSYVAAAEARRTAAAETVDTRCLHEAARELLDLLAGRHHGAGELLAELADADGAMVVLDAGVFMARYQLGDLARCVTDSRADPQTIWAVRRVLALLSGAAALVHSLAAITGLSRDPSVLAGGIPPRPMSWLAAFGVPLIVALVASWRAVYLSLTARITLTNSAENLPAATSPPSVWHPSVVPSNAPPRTLRALLT